MCRRLGKSKRLKRQYLQQPVAPIQRLNPATTCVVPTSVACCCRVEVQADGRVDIPLPPIYSTAKHGLPDEWLDPQARGAGERMRTAQVLVTVLGVLTILWINYYFFLADRGVAVAAVSLERGTQRVGIEVRGGYSPAVLRVRAGRKVRLEFRREETGGCTEEVVIPAFGVRTFLPAHRTTPVEFTPEKPGSYEFTCGMGMVRGRIIVEGENT